MANHGYGNFAFMYDIDLDFYNDLAKIEKNARIDIASVGNPLRQALERFIHIVIDKYRLGGFIPSNLTLWEKLDRLEAPQTLQYARALNRNTPMPQGSLLPLFREQTDYSTIDGSGKIVTQTKPYYTYLRLLGNAFSHAGDWKNEPRKTFKNMEKALHLLHKILREFYGVTQAPAFDADRMPIAEFIIDSCSKPSDRYSKCETEYMAHSLDRDGNPEFYALLRLYRRSNLDTNFMLRNRDCFVVAARESDTGVPDGMTRMRELTPRDSNNEFYIIAYIFNREATMLSNELLQQMQLPQRLELCKRLTKSLATLHNAETPIYHRLLNNECIYVSRRRESWIPYIVKFDYAKIDIKALTSIQTVKPQAVAATQAYMAEAIKSRYIPAEWPEKEGESTDVDWSKVDVYSLGVLLMDILYGKFSIIAPYGIYRQLNKLGLSQRLLQTLGNMCQEKPEARCSMQQALAALEQEVL